MTQGPSAFFPCSCESGRHVRGPTILGLRGLGDCEAGGRGRQCRSSRKSSIGALITLILVERAPKRHSLEGSVVCLRKCSSFDMQLS